MQLNSMINVRPNIAIAGVSISILNTFVVSAASVRLILNSLASAGISGLGMEALISVITMSITKGIPRQNR